MKKILVAMIALASLFFMGCKGENLEGNWTVSNLLKDNVEQNVVPANITFTTENGELLAAGTSGVNNFSVVLEAKNGKIKVSDKFALTKMMGSPEEQAFEDLFIETLTNADSYELTENNLVIKNSSNNLEIKLTKN